MTFTLITRSLIIYFLVLFLLRIMGKRQIGEMQPFELVITLIIADLATIPMSDTALPLIHGVIPLLTLVCVHFLLAVLSRKSIFFRKVLNGRPVIVVDPDGINYESLKKLNMNFNDLMESLHTANYFNLETVLYAIVQTNGTLTVIPRAPYSPLCANDLGLDKEQSTLPIIIISEGKIMQKNLELIKFSTDELTKQIKKAGFNKIKEVMFATIDNIGKMYVQPKNGPFITYTVPNFKGGEW